MQAVGERKATVLQAVVQDYIRTGEPVGSGSIARRYRLGVSPATIRSEMAALEEMGFLAQPHTSAGRIPTDHGYRFYVDHLPRRLTLSRGIGRQIASFYADPVPDVDDLLQGTAALLSRLTGYAAVALTPRLSRSRVLRAELVPVGSSVMLLVVSDTGRVDKRVLDLGAEPAAEIVERASQLLSERLTGLSYDEASRRAASLARQIAEEERRLVRDVAAALAELRDPQAEHVYVGGVANIADEDAFQRRETLRELVETLEERSAVLEVLEAALDALGDVSVRIGRENSLRALAEASLVVAWYEAQERPAGAIAVVGPTRMAYPRAISTAQAVAGRLSELMSGFAG
jgi:heat-inducible transcriptional repressor